MLDKLPQNDMGHSASGDCSSLHSCRLHAKPVCVYIAHEARPACDWALCGDVTLVATLHIRCPLAHCTLYPKFHTNARISPKCCSPQTLLPLYEKEAINISMAQNCWKLLQQRQGDRILSAVVHYIQ